MKDMFFGAKKHILSNAILISALARMLEFILSGILRFVAHKTDISSELINALQIALSIFTVLLSAVVFIYYLHKAKTYLSLVDEEDRAEMGMLQAEVFGKDNSTLNGDIISKLLRVWFAILVGAQIMYDVSSGLYSRFIALLNFTTALYGDATGAGYAYFYDFTHGFKYQGMLIALLLGIVVTAIFLDDRVLRVMSYVVALLFLLSSLFMRMTSLNMLGNVVGIVWTSVIFHVIDTVGLMAFALYMRIRYKGM